MLWPLAVMSTALAIAGLLLASSGSEAGRPLALPAEPEDRTVEFRDMAGNPTSGYFPGYTAVILLRDIRLASRGTCTATWTSTEARVPANAPWYLPTGAPAGGPYVPPYGEDCTYQRDAPASTPLTFPPVGWDIRITDSGGNTAAYLVGPVDPQAGSFSLQYTIEAGSTVKVRFTFQEPVQDIYPAEARLVKVSSDSDPQGEWLAIAEVVSESDPTPGLVSALFRGEVLLGQGQEARNTPGAIWVQPGDQVTVEFLDIASGEVVSSDSARVESPPTPTPSATPTATPSPTPTATPAPEATATPSLTPTDTPSPTPTATPDLEATSTPSPSATPTETPAPEATPMPTATSTSTATPSPTPTATPAPEATATPSLTPTRTLTATPASSPSSGGGSRGRSEDSGEDGPSPTPTQAAAVCDYSGTGQPVIKGNISGGERIYHVPGSPYYERTIIDESRGERWFCTVAEAEAAGWRPPRVAPSPTPTPPQTSTPTPTPTPTPTATYTPLPTATATMIPVATTPALPSPTPTPAPTPSPMPTPTHTPTPTATPSPTATATPSALREATERPAEEAKDDMPGTPTALRPSASVEETREASPTTGPASGPAAAATVAVVQAPSGPGLEEAIGVALVAFGVAAGIFGIVHSLMARGKG